MTSKRLVLDAIYNRETKRTPWVPLVGCHAAALTGVSAEEYLKSSRRIVAGVFKAYELYSPDGIPVLFDLQVEAEAMGCKLKYAADNPPSVVTHPLEQGVGLEELKIPGETDGRFPTVMKAARLICGELGRGVAVYGLVTGPFTLACQLMGTGIFREMADDPGRVRQLMQLCMKVCSSTSRMYIDAGVDVVAVADPMTSRISPDDFREFVSPCVSEVFKYIRSVCTAGSFLACGGTGKNIEEMCKCRPDNISVGEDISLEEAAGVCRNYGVSVGGNIKPAVMLSGTPEDNIRDAENCMAIGGRKGYILSPGCDIPFAAPMRNIEAISGCARGEVADFLEAEYSSVLDGIEYRLPDYNKEEQVIINVITLDSGSCTPCRHVMKAVKAAAEPFGNTVRYAEHKIMEKESLACMLKLGVKDIPAIVIDGRIKYAGVIPDVVKLQECIGEAVDAKKAKSCRCCIER